MKKIYSLIEFSESGKSKIRKEIAGKISVRYIESILDQKLPAHFIPLLEQFYIPVSEWIINRKNKLEPLVVGINGSQGSGKTTFAYFLKQVLEHGYNQRVANFSIDDFYHTKAAREQLSINTHKLLITRGVPGTHDLGLGIDVMESLLKADKYSVTSIPTFNKAIDDREDESKWQVFEGRPDVILFEGWCVGAKPQAVAELESPVNILERNHDVTGNFRKFVNDSLKGNYKNWFSYIDVLVMLKVPSFEKVYEWRLLQEQKLAERVKKQKLNERIKIMNSAEVEYFISHYERLTRYMLYEMPQRADMVIEIDDDHNYNKIVIQK